MTQFISIFNVVGVRNAKRLDRFVLVLRHRVGQTGGEMRDREQNSRCPSARGTSVEKEEKARRRKEISDLKSSLSKHQKDAIRSAMCVFSKRKFLKNLDFLPIKKYYYSLKQTLEKKA